MSLLYLHSGTVGLDEGIHKAAEALYDTLQKGGSQERGVPRRQGAGTRVADLAARPPRLRPAAVPAEEVTRVFLDEKKEPHEYRVIPSGVHDYKV